MSGSFHPSPRKPRAHTSYHPPSRRPTQPKVLVPKMDIYGTAIAQCERLYQRLNLNRSQTMISREQYGLKSKSSSFIGTKVETIKSRSARSAPSNVHVHQNVPSYHHYLTSKSPGASHLPLHLSAQEPHHVHKPQDFMKQPHGHHTDRMPSIMSPVDKKQTNPSGNRVTFKDRSKRSNVIPPDIFITADSTEFTEHTTEHTQHESAVPMASYIEGDWNNPDNKQFQFVDHFAPIENCETSDNIKKEENNDPVNPHGASECSSNVEQGDGDPRKRHYLNSNLLCDILRKRGYGDPRDRNKPKVKDPLPVLLKRQKQAKKNNFYMEKLKGKSRMDCDMANAQAVAFCEQQKAQIRTASANFRLRMKAYFANQNVQNQSDVDDMIASGGEDGDEDEAHEYLDEEAVKRIQAWMEGVRAAFSCGVGGGGAGHSTGHRGAVKTIVLPNENITLTIGS